MKAGPQGLMIPTNDWHADTIAHHSMRYEIFSAFFDTGGVAIDGGAHVGYWTMKMCNDFDLVLAYEPNPETYECLLRNATHFNQSNVNISQKALGSKFSYGIMKLGGRPGNSGAWFVDTSNDPLAEVPIVTIDSALNSMPLNLIKLDVEGMEYSALVGGEEWIKRDWPTIIIEQNICASKHYGKDDNAASDLLKEWGYEIQASSGKDFCYTKR